MSRQGEEKGGEGGGMVQWCVNIVQKVSIVVNGESFIFDCQKTDVVEIFTLLIHNPRKLPSTNTCDGTLAKPCHRVVPSEPNLVRLRSVTFGGLRLWQSTF